MDSQGPLLPTDRIRIYVACRACDGTGKEPNPSPYAMGAPQCRVCLNGTSNPSSNTGVFEQWVTVAELVALATG